MAVAHPSTASLRKSADHSVLMAQGYNIAKLRSPACLESYSRGEIDRINRDRRNGRDCRMNKGPFPVSATTLQTVRWGNDAYSKAESSSSHVHELEIANSRRSRTRCLPKVDA